MADSSPGSGGELKQRQLIKCNPCNRRNLRVLFPWAPRDTPRNRRGGLEKRAQQEDGDSSGARLLGKISCCPPALPLSQSSHSNQLKKSSTTNTLLCCPRQRSYSVPVLWFPLPCFALQLSRQNLPDAVRTAAQQSNLRLIPRSLCSEGAIQTAL